MTSKGFGGDFLDFGGDSPYIVPLQPSRMFYDYIISHGHVLFYL